MIADPGEHIGEPCARIDVVQPGGDHELVHGGSALPAAIGAGKQPRLAAERDAAQSAFGGIVGKTDPAIAQEAREGIPSLEHVVDRLGDIGMPGHLAPRGAHPALQ